METYTANYGEESEKWAVNMSIQGCHILENVLGIIIWIVFQEQSSWLKRDESEHSASISMMNKVIQKAQETNFRGLWSLKTEVGFSYIEQTVPGDNNEWTGLEHVYIHK